MTDFVVSAHQMAVLSHDAYSKKPDIEIDEVEVLVRDIGPNTAAVAFRGTTLNGKDILRDLRAIPWWDQKLGLCHKGFLISAGQAYSAVYAELQRRNAMRVVCTGHSLGAAQATLTMAWLTWEYLPQDLQLVTFGSPRVGRNLERALKRVKICRYIFGQDIVTTLPWPIIYRHVGPALPLGDPTDDERDGIYDHRIINYVEALAA